MTPEQALENAISKAGSMQALGDHLGVTKGAVGQWKLPGRQVPATHCRAIEVLTGGTSRCEDLRPDVFASQSPSVLRSCTESLDSCSGHAGRQLPSSTNILDTVPERSVVGVDPRSGA